MTKRAKTFDFKKGEKFSISALDNIQNYPKSDWWEKTGDDLRENDCIDMSESFICTKSTKITITIETT